MRIFTNISALTANRYLDRADKQASASMTKLSSGYRINYAKDDAVGMAMSNKLKMQIKSLERAEKNANDGSSIIGTAEGALNEVSSMLTRMSELAVQAANDTNTIDDRAALQNEMDELSEEINRICEDTDFNTKSLLDGTLCRHSNAYVIQNGTLKGINGVSLNYLTDGVDEGKYVFDVTSEPTKATTTLTMTSAATQAGTVTVNGVEIEIEEGDTIDDVASKLKALQDAATTTVTSDDSAISLEHYYYGSKNTVTISFSDEETAALFGYTFSEGEELSVSTKGTDTGIKLYTSDDGFSETATVTTDGEYMTVVDRGGFEMTIKVSEGTYSNNYSNDISCTRVRFSVVSAGSMTLQIGANEGQTLEVNIPKVNTETLGIAEVNIRTHEAASNAITAINGAIERVNSICSQLGAYENRLEAAVSNVQVTTENLTSSLSTIEDVDMAAEMTTYTTKNLISQASIAMLSQANQSPEKVLQILQG